MPKTTLDQMRERYAESERANANRAAAMEAERANRAAAMEAERVQQEMHHEETRQRAKEKKRKKPTRRVLHHAVIRQVRAPHTTSVIELFERMSSNTWITFFVNGYPLGEFEFTKNDYSEDEFEFTCYSKSFNPLDHDEDATGSCILITINARGVQLDDYFYYANKEHYNCEMKPINMEKHKMFLKTLLEFLAYAFRKQRITLQDAAQRKYKYCPALWTGVHLVGGLGSFYEKAAGFQNDTATSVANRVGAMPVPSRFRTTFGNTLREVAHNIVQHCKAEHSDLLPQDTVLLDYIQSLFRQTYRDATGSTFLDYAKTFTGIYGCRIKHSDDQVNGKLVNPVNLEPDDPIKKYLFMDIIT
jgi:hypothetical protein